MASAFSILEGLTCGGMPAPKNPLSFYREISLEMPFLEEMASLSFSWAVAPIIGDIPRILPSYCPNPADGYIPPMLAHAPC